MLPLLQVADEGGGIKRSGMPRIWTYLYTTSVSPLSLMDDSFEGADSPTVMAGYGVGLPISRLYARYFGGDLNITSMEVSFSHTCLKHLTSSCFMITGQQTWETSAYCA